MKSKGEEKPVKIKGRLEKPLGDILVEEGFLKPEDLYECLEIQRKTGERLGKILIKYNYATEEAVAKALQRRFSIPYIDISSVEVTPEVLALIPKELMESELVLPLYMNGNSLIVAVADPLNLAAIDTIRRLTRRHVDVQITTETAIREFLRKTLGVKSDAQHAMAAVKEEIRQREIHDERKEKTFQISQTKEDAAAIVRLVHSIITQGIYDGASDVHIEPCDDEVRVRYRKDGILQTVLKVPKAVQEEVIVRIKILSGMDISERRRPQDGHAKLRVDNRSIDLRVSSFPGVLGEKIVIRILDQRMALLYLEELGFSENNLEKLVKVMQAPYGLFLITGPTGSGKTTTLYAVLHKLNKESLNIITIEDPVEYRFPSITQMQVNSAIQLDFVDGLRSSLRQDPDIILVGEIRDKETLETAIQASMTGHLVLSTLHTNNAILAFPRMVQLGIPPHLIFSTLIGMMAQRLIRKLCPHCRKSNFVSAKYLRDYGFEIMDDEAEIFEPVGCDKCDFKGYLGRSTVAEVILLTDELQAMFLKGVPLTEIRSYLKEKKERFMEDDALEKILSGTTSLQEVLRMVKVGEK